jgi:hypothetical protein
MSDDRDRKKLIRLIQDAIDKGATTAEEVHKSIADLPLRILEESEFLREPAREAKRVQDHTLGAIYDAIREINEKVGAYATDLLVDAGKHRPVRSGTGKTRRASTVSTARKPRPSKVGTARTT